MKKKKKKIPTVYTHYELYGYGTDRVFTYAFIHTAKDYKRKYPVDFQLGDFTRDEDMLYFLGLGPQPPF